MQKITPWIWFDTEAEEAVPAFPRAEELGADAGAPTQLADPEDAARVHVLHYTRHEQHLDKGGDANGGHSRRQPRPHPAGERRPAWSEAFAADVARGGGLHTYRVEFTSSGDAARSSAPCCRATRG